MAKSTKKHADAEKMRYRTVKTLVDLAGWCGVSAKTMGKWRAEKGFPIESNGEFSPARVTEWKLIKKWDPAGSESDPDLAGPVSPMLERCREEKWKMYRLDRMEREGQLVDRARMRAFIMCVASHFRDFGGQFQREFGPAGHTFWRDCLDQIESATEKEFGPDDQKQIGEATLTEGKTP